MKATDINEVMRILGGSKRFHFDYNNDGYSCVLVVQSYNTGKGFKLDLSKLDAEMLEALQPDEEETED